MTDTVARVKPFAELVPLLNRHSSHISLEDNEGEAYYDVIQTLPDGATILEIGCQYGRSSAIAAHSSRDFALFFVDPYALPHEREIRRQWKATMDSIGVPYTHYPWYSNSPFIPRIDVDLLLIDADHTFDFVTNDCNRFLPWVKRGGYAVFHDYGRLDTNAVQEVVDSHPLLNSEFDRVRLEGTLLIWRRKP